MKERVRMPGAVCLVAMLGMAGCAKSLVTGSLGEGSNQEPRIVSVDSSRPPRAVTVQLDQQSYVALLLVAPGHSATLLYPDSATDNRLGAGTHRLSFSIPDPLLRLDTLRPRMVGDVRIRARARPGMSAIPPETRTYLLLVTSPQPLVHARLFAVTAGVSIPVVETEALNAVGKAVKSTISEEPRAWAGHFVQVGLFPAR